MSNMQNVLEVWLRNFFVKNIVRFQGNLIFVHQFFHEYWQLYGVHPDD